MRESHIENYIRMFEFTRLPVLVVDSFVKGYENLEVVAIFDGKWFRSYLPKKHLGKTAQEGIDIYSNQTAFNELKEKFYSYRNRAQEFFENLTQKGKITIDDFTKFFQLWAELYTYYQRTEFFYVDSAYEYSKKDEETRKILEEFGKFKYEGREWLNTVVFTGKRYAEKILEIMARQFSSTKSALFDMTSNEIVDLYSGHKISNQILHEREKAYVIGYEKSRVDVLQGEYAKDYFEKIGINSTKETADLKGTVANRGKARGIARVMIFNFEKVNAIGELIGRMDKGDILITETTSPEWTPACAKAGAIVTAQGGLMSHAAIVSRELGIPCIVGVRDVLKIINDGDIVEVDADNGAVRILNK